MVFYAGYGEQAKRAERAWWLTLATMIAFGFCVVRLAFLQVVKGAALTRASESNYTQIVVERAPRGRILDRNGVVLAGDQPVFVALFSPLGLSNDQFQQTLSHLSEILLVPGPELERRLRGAVRSKTMSRVSDRLSRSQAFRILQDRARLPGVSLTIEEQRFYPKEAIASHVLGYVGQITEDELTRFREQGYRSGDWIGKTGLERLYDPLLHGQDGGILIQVDARGRQVKMLRHVLPLAGNDVVLTIDHDLQALAESRLQETGHPGAAVLVNPTNGQVLALASSPGFNPNVFLPLGNSEERRELIQDNETKPLYNRAIQAFYPPGSTFKPLSGLAMLLRPDFSPDDRVECRGFYTLGKEKRVFKCWKPHGHGSVDFLQAMAHSCDVYYYTKSLEIGQHAIERVAEQFLLGKRTGIDLPNEKTWDLPVAYKARRREYWTQGQTLNYAIGQGDTLVTPLQMAMVASTLGNGGTIWQPYVVTESRRFGEPPRGIGTPRVMGRLNVPARALALIQRSLEEVVATGTGLAAQIKGFRVCGKTGTAQAPKGGDHAWFIAYAPAGAPTVACAVVVENGGHGGAVAAPIVRDLLVLALGARNVPPAPREVSSD